MTEPLPAARLARHGAAGAQIEELADYLERARRAGSGGVELPLPDEPFVDWWRERAEEAARDGAFPVLRRHLPQLAFPIREGMSADPAYRAATLAGVPAEEVTSGPGLALTHPERLELEIHPSPAGRIPVLLVRSREGFEALLQALARRNEPEPVAGAQGAAMVAGYANMARLRELRRRWAEGPPDERPASAEEERERLRRHKPHFQDRFILVWDGPYSSSRARDLGLDDAAWRRASLRIRREHECVHYFTKRRFGTMLNHVHDELMADYAGLVAAFGEFSAELFLRLIGAHGGDGETPPPGARIHLYRGRPPLSDGSFAVLRRILAAAARRLEEHHRARPLPAGDVAAAGRRLSALASLRLDEIADDDGGERLLAAEAGPAAPPGFSAGAARRG